MQAIVYPYTQIATAAEQQGAVAADANRNVNEIVHSSGQLVAAAERLAASGSQMAGLSVRRVEASAGFRR